MKKTQNARKTDEFETVRCLIEKKTKKQAVKILDKNSLSITDAITDLFAFIAKNEEYPFEKEEKIKLKK